MGGNYRQRPAVNHTGRDFPRRVSRPRKAVLCCPQKLLPAQLRNGGVHIGLAQAHSLRHELEVIIANHIRAPAVKINVVKCQPGDYAVGR